MMFRFSLLLFSLWAFSVHADLYRWVDPETGSVKFSSYPPPWHGDPARARRAPKVEVIPPGRPAAPAPAEAPDPASVPAAAVPDAGLVGALERRRKDMLQRIPVLASQAGSPAGGQALAKHLEAFKALAEEMDRIDPQGAVARGNELQSLVQKSMTRSPR